MRISKPARHVLYLLSPLLVARALFTVTYAWLGRLSLLFSLLVVPPISIVVTLPIDSLDLWLRRRTRDPSWLLTNEGRAWLATPEGREWVEARRDRVV
jgi:hypothetical protein